MTGSESSSKRRREIWVTGRGVAFRGEFSPWRRGVSSSAVPCDLLGDIESGWFSMGHAIRRRTTGAFIGAIACQRTCNSLMSEPWSSKENERAEMEGALTWQVSGLLNVRERDKTLADPTAVGISWATLPCFGRSCSNGWAHTATSKE